jgi:hypothetical protein
MLISEGKHLPVSCSANTEAELDKPAGFFDHLDLEGGSNRIRLGSPQWKTSIGAHE